MRIYNEIFLFLLFKVDLSSILPIMVKEYLLWYFQETELNDIFVIKNSNAYQTVLLARPTVVSVYMYNSCKSEMVSYHPPYGRFFDIHFMTDSPLKIFVTPSFLLQWHD